MDKFFEQLAREISWFVSLEYYRGHADGTDCPDGLDVKKALVYADEIRPAIQEHIWSIYKATQKNIVVEWLKRKVEISTSGEALIRAKDIARVMPYAYKFHDIKITRGSSLMRFREIKDDDNLLSESGIIITKEENGWTIKLAT